MAETQGITVPGESGSSSMNPTLQQKHTKAVADGWKPLDEFEGDPVDWVDYPEFVARGPLLEEIRGLKKHIKQQREKTDQDMRLISSQFAQMSEQAYKRAITDLESRRDVAIGEQDIAAVRNIDKEIDSAKTERAQAAATASVVSQKIQNVEPTEELIVWRKENKWFDSDQELQDEAVAIGVGYLAKNPNKTQVDMLKHVTDRIKKIYPEKFKRKETIQVDETEKNDNTRVEGSSGANRPNTLGNQSKKGKLTVADLDDDEKNIMKTLIRRGALKGLAEKNKRTEQEEFLVQLGERKAKG